MNVVRIEATVVAVPLLRPFETAHGVREVQRSLVIAVYDSDGAVGVGNIDPSPGYSRESVADHFAMVRDHFGPAMLGEPADNVHRMLYRLDAINPAFLDAKAALEMACLDLTARRAGLSMATLLGGAVREEVRFNAWIGMLAPDVAAREAADCARAGFRSCKVKVGGDVATDCARVIAVREATGASFSIRADGNEGYCEVDAIAFIERSTAAKLQLYEQPIPGDDLVAMARVRARANAVGVPLMADEALIDHASLIAIIRADAADIVKVKVMKQGGMLGTRRMIATAEAAGLPCVIGHGYGLGISTHAEMIVAATSINVMEGIECVGPLKMRDDVINAKPDLSSGVLPLPTALGLGVTLDPDRLRNYAIDTATIR